MLFICFALIGEPYGKDNRENMTVHRRSNWYIYLLAFGITAVFVVMAIMAFKWYLFPENTDEVDLNKNGELTKDFKPTSEYDFNIITMLSEGETDNPELFVMASYNAVDSRLAFIPLPAGISIEKDERTLTNIYAAQGGEGVINALENIFGVRCDCYVKLDRRGFNDIVTSFGNIEYNIQSTLIVKDGSEVETFNAGSKMLTAESVYRLMMKADFGEGESYRFNIVGDLLAATINQNFRELDTSMLDTFFNELMSAAETNLTESLYRSKKAALLNTIEYGVDPGEFYVPYGEYSDDGAFKVAETSIISVRQRAGLE